MIRSTVDERVAVILRAVGLPSGKIPTQRASIKAVIEKEIQDAVLQERAVCSLVARQTVQRMEANIEAGRANAKDVARAVETDVLNWEAQP